MKKGCDGGGKNGGGNGKKTGKKRGENGGNTGKKWEGGGKTDGNSGHYVIASSRPHKRQPMERRTLVPKMSKIVA